MNSIFFKKEAWFNEATNAHLPDGWYFWDETGMEPHGPYMTKYRTEEELAKYCKYLDGELPSQCTKHKEWIEKYNGSLRELVEDVGDLHYEALTDFLFMLADKLDKDATKDYTGNRPKLAKKLWATASSCAEAAEHISQAWKICKPFMENK